MRYIKDHWNGDHTLVRAFWVNNGLLGLVLYLIWQFIGIPILFGMAENNNVSGIIAVTLVWVAISLLVSIWMIVGVWRSAEVYKHRKNQNGQSAGWGVAAQVLMAFAALGILINVISLLILLGRT